MHSSRLQRALLLVVLSSIGSAQAQCLRVLPQVCVPDLHDYAARGDYENVRRRVRPGRSFDRPSKRAHLRTPLHMAAEFGQASIVELLAEAGADLNARTDQGFAPLHLAACRDMSSSIYCLLAAGAEREARDDRGRTALHLAAMSDSVEALRALLPSSNGALSVDSHDWTPLHFAGRYAGEESLQLLADFTDNLDQRTKSGSTALHLAASRADTKLTGILIAAGASTDELDFLRRTAAEVFMERASRHERPGPQFDVAYRLAVPKQLTGKGRERRGDPMLFTTWHSYGAGSGPPPTGTDLAIWSDGVVLFSQAAFEPNQHLRLGLLSQERLALLWRELEESGVLDYQGNSQDGPCSTVRTLNIARSGRWSSAGSDGALRAGAQIAEEASFYYAYWSAAEILELAIPEDSWPLEEICGGRSFRGYTPSNPQKWLRAWWKSRRQ